MLFEQFSNFMYLVIVVFLQLGALEGVEYELFGYRRGLLHVESRQVGPVEQGADPFIEGCPVAAGENESAEPPSFPFVGNGAVVSQVFMKKRLYGEFGGRTPSLSGRCPPGRDAIRV